MSDEPSAPSSQARLSELAADLQALLSSDANAMPAPVAFSIGDALEAVEAALQAAGHVGLLAIEARPPARDAADARRRVGAVRDALVELLPRVSAKARREVAVAVAELAPWQSVHRYEQATEQWLPQDGTW